MSTVNKNISDISSLHWVVKSSDWTLGEIKEHLEQGFYYVEELDDQGRTPLFSLVKRPNCSASVVEVLIQNGAKVDRVDLYGKTPLLVALENENCSVDVVKVLLYYGADPNRRCLMGTSPLLTALHHTRDEAFVRLLLEKKAKLQNCRTDPSPLCTALCSDASKDIIKLLLDYGCNLDGCNRHNSALHCATSFPNPGLGEDILQVLLDAGANVESANLDGQQLMCFALQNGANVSTVKILLQAGVSLEACTCHTTPFLCATSPYSEFLDMTKVSQLKSKRPEGYVGIPLKADVVQFLLDAERSSWSEEGFKPVVCALKYCDYETKAIELLLDRASRRRMSTRRKLFFQRLINRTIFSYNATPAVVKLFIKRKYLKVGMLNRYSKETLLHRALATERCHPAMIKVLLEMGCSSTAENARSWTPLETAIIYRKNAMILNLLLAGGSRIGARAQLKPPLLNLAIQQYDCNNTTNQLRVLEKTESLKTLFRFAFLEFPDFNIGYLVGPISKIMLGFVKGCVTEVRNMERKVVSWDTLFNTVTQRKTQLGTQELDQLLDILLNTSFPIYMDLISSKIDRKMLVNKFQDLSVYTARSCNSIKQKCFLDYECICKIAEFLSVQGILSFFLAYYY